MSHLRFNDFPDCVSSFFAGDVDFLIATEIQVGVVRLAGANQWDIGLNINPMPLSRKQDSRLDHIWQHLKTSAPAKQLPLT